MIRDFESINNLAERFPDLIFEQTIPLNLEYTKESFKNYQKELAINGFIHLRKIFPIAKIERAASVLTNYLIENQYLTFDNEKKPVLLKDKGILLSGYRPITHHPDFLNLVEGKEIKTFFDILFEEPSATLDTKWVRIFGPNEATDTHSDYYRFKPLGLPLYTCWIPLTNQGMKEGTLALFKGSHLFDLNGDSMDQLELPKDISDLVAKSKWFYGDYKLGDCVIFDIRCIHASFRNQGSSFRMNTDTRWIPKKNSHIFWK